MPDKTETQHLSEGASAFFIQKRVFAFFCHNRQKKVPARHERYPSEREIKYKGEKDNPPLVLQTPSQPFKDNRRTKKGLYVQSFFILLYHNLHAADVTADVFTVLIIRL